MRELLTKATVLAVVAVIVFSVVAAIGLVPERLAVGQVQGTVTDKYIKRFGDNDYFHVVVQFDDGTTEIFHNHDALWWWKWNSADVQQKIKVGQTYHFIVTGWRVPFLSWFRNIVEVTPPQIRGG